LKTDSKTLKTRCHHQSSNTKSKIASINSQGKILSTLNITAIKIWAERSISWRLLWPYWI